MSGQNKCKTKEKAEALSDREELALKNNVGQMETYKHSKRFWCACALSRKLRAAYSDYLAEDDPAKKLDLSAAVQDMFDRSFFRIQFLRSFCIKEDLRILRERYGRVEVTDHSGRNKKDYYSVAVIVKNEARYIKEFILFYQATGADRIYIYDNDSTDDLLGQIEPFLKSGFVIYIKWPGHAVQTAAYRDAVRRTRRRSRWLAIIDADEFLFSPKGSMPEQLRSYEQYPGIGVNWVLFGPSGHDRRPEGLLMDNYTMTYADHDSFMNCHVKSIVQPKEILLIDHTHFAYYRRGRFAVDECGEVMNNRNAFSPLAGRAFTLHTHRDIFRINHYITKSLEDLEEKCKRGYADGAQNPNVKDQLALFNEPLEEDHAIKPYADIVRERYNKKERTDERL